MFGYAYSFCMPKELHAWFGSRMLEGAAGLYLQRFCAALSFGGAWWNMCCGGLDQGGLVQWLGTG